MQQIQDLIQSAISKVLDSECKSADKDDILSDLYELENYFHHMKEITNR